MSSEALQENMGPSVGQLLKAARLARDLNLEAIAKSLRISKRYLAHLEEDDETLVCDVYSLGFLRSYAQYLELDVNSLIQKFKTQTSPPQPPHLTFPAPLPERGMPSFRILAFSFLAFLAVIILGWKWFGYYEPSFSPREEVAFLEPEVQVEEVLPSQELPSQEPAPITEQNPLSPLSTSVAEEESRPIESPTTALQPLIPSSEVLLKTTEEAWIEVKDHEGHVILSRLFEPGESYKFKNPIGLVLTTGNAKGTSLISGGKKRSFFERSGAVKTNIPLDPEKWVEQNPQTH